jgi:hypothetical protein
VRDGRGFDAHELLEEPGARQVRARLYQGPHVAVATCQDGCGNAVGCTRQLEKACGPEPYAPSYEVIDIAGSFA